MCVFFYLMSTPVSALGRLHFCYSSEVDCPLRPPTDPCGVDGLFEKFLAYVHRLGMELYPAQEEAILEVCLGCLHWAFLSPFARTLDIDCLSKKQPFRFREASKKMSTHGATIFPIVCMSYPDIQKSQTAQKKQTQNNKKWGALGFCIICDLSLFLWKFVNFWVGQILFCVHMVKCASIRYIFLAFFYFYQGIRVSLNIQLLSQSELFVIF